MPTAQATQGPAPQRVLQRVRVVQHFGGRTVFPLDVSTSLGVDRAAACRLLQRLVQLGQAKRTAQRGAYYVYKKR